MFLPFRRLSVLCATLLAGLWFISMNPSEARAQSSAQTGADRDREVRERLVIVGRQRMLAEALAEKLCYAEAGVAPEKNLGELYVLWNIFGWYHRGIRSGNRELELGPEPNRDVLLAWKGVDTHWQQLSRIYEPAIAGDTVTPTAFANVISKTDDVSQAAIDLMSRLRAAYADELGPRGFGSALLIDLYERQRMLGEQISKDVCLISQGDTATTRLESLTRTIEIFSASLAAFQNGRSDVGVPAPPTDGIARSLSDAQAHWQPVAAFAYASAIGQQLGPTELGEFSDAMNRFIVSMTAAINDLVLYQTQARQ